MVVAFAGGAVEGGFVSDRAARGAAAEGVVEDRPGDGGVGEIADALPAEGKALRAEVGPAESVGGVFGVGHVGGADAEEPVKVLRTTRPTPSS